LAFQNQVSAQVAPVDSALAQTFIDAAQQVIDIVDAGNTNPSGRPHGKRISLARQPDGRVQMQVATGTVPCIIEASTNLVDWEMIGVATGGPEGTLGFEDSQAMRFARRFYRVISP